MSSPLELNLEACSHGDEKAVCHLMPCRIEHRGLELKAKEYFWPTIRELGSGDDNDQGRKTNHEHPNDAIDQSTENPILLASFRGRPLQGRRLMIPEGFSGHVISKPAKTMQNPSARNKVIAKHFNEFTYWNWDELPTQSDGVVKALGWLNVTKAIHDPI